MIDPQITRKSQLRYFAEQILNAWDIWIDLYEHMVNQGYEEEAKLLERSGDAILDAYLDIQERVNQL